MKTSQTITDLTKSANNKKQESENLIKETISKELENYHSNLKQESQNWMKETQKGIYTLIKMTTNEQMLSIQNCLENLETQTTQKTTQMNETIQQKIKELQIAIDTATIMYQMKTWKENVLLIALGAMIGAFITFLMMR